MTYAYHRIIKGGAGAVIMRYPPLEMERCQGYFNWHFINPVPSKSEINHF
jgi:hypothetical protein